MCSDVKMCYTIHVMKKCVLFRRAHTAWGRLLQVVFIFCLIGFAAWIFSHGLRYFCPIRWTFGIECPACGMTRAAEALLHLDIAAAFAANPLVFVAVIYAGILAFAWIADRPGLIRSKKLWAVFIVVFLSFWAVRIAAFRLGQYPSFYEPNALLPTVIRKFIS